MIEYFIRRQTFFEREKNIKVDCVLSTSKENIRYFTNFTGSDGILLITPFQTIIITDSRYELQIKEETENIKFHIIKNYELLFKLLEQIFKKNKIKTLGINSQTLSLAEYKKLNSIKGLVLKDIGNSIEKFRSIKSSKEIEKIKEGCRITSEAFRCLLNIIKEEITELDIYAEFEYIIKKKFNVGIAFDTIFLTGERTALPHGKPSKKKLKKDDLILVDFGINIDGYNTDVTRTFKLGKFNKEQKKIFNIVKNSQELAISKIINNIPSSEIDKEVRKYLKMEGYNKYFKHGLGHGVGLSVHELPKISSSSKDKLEIGNIFTIEPGIYVPNFGGVRIEDMILLNEKGVEILTSDIPKIINI